MTQSLSLRNCVECGALFASSGATRCPGCIEREEEAFETVRAYLMGRSTATVDEICEATGVPHAVILKFLKQGRLLAQKIQGVTLQCDVCGAPVATGRLCESCWKMLKAETDQKPPIQDRATERMYTFNLHTKEKARK